MILMPDVNDLMRLHEKVAARSGGSAALRDASLVESALMRASAGFAGVELYPGVIEKAAAAGCGIVENHGFIDGNKRTGVMTMLLILRMNGVSIRHTQRELIDLGLGLAEGKIRVDGCIEWIRAHCA